MYYVLTCEVPSDDEGGYLDIQDGIEIDGMEYWAIGERFSVKLSEAIIVEVEPIEGFRGDPPEFYDGNMCFMSKKLVETLKAAGVNNIDCYDLILRNTETNDEYDYYAVNIIGLVSAADLGKSKWQSYDNKVIADVSFESITIDKEMAKGLLIFRMAENNGVILVHDKVKRILEEQGFDGLKFFDPKNHVLI